MQQSSNLCACMMNAGKRPALERDHLGAKACRSNYYAEVYAYVMISARDTSDVGRKSVDDRCCEAVLSSNLSRRFPVGSMLDSEVEMCLPAV